ncbi:branched-chain amino acid ABC transporter permease [Paenirhodobacter populi]|uniref:Branched-chain amino acid ABC transporter permease n=1 Tax=Paenirhodobacter populi TaxID=2306993 RepID=A0A443JBP5_9RHOB|nr:branched-chain amino acid ABC transporter permease [Sinirhodobacter populi]RWR06389.1 branched-chain amino acid ABC transporter permease [Sinirhodobacter populi]RWR09106.1 branched-chain amino acid ABC transporter permease [Sinirhodobacter populi]RWR17932.1 branched-chain amino acid ABC transporter permease [Sinirhodobacter populi]RWR27014.1 branched-chain amino acid ABC transporter permease [Sinirhodobacter populi]RWR28149.1 branched-chain amino acid ABC transporter permease [Sinirhodobact
MVLFFLSQLLNGLLDGFYYMLIALGLSLIFSLGGIVNLAHGVFFTLGAYLALVLTPHVGFFGALALGPLIAAVIAIVIERFLFTRFYREDPLYSLLLTFGLAMIIEQSLRWYFGATPRAYSMPADLRGQVFVGDFVYSRYRLFLIGMAIVTVAAVWALLNRTAFGRIVRAGIQNPDILGTLGISLRPYLSAVVAIAIGIAALAGVLMAPIQPVHPLMGVEVGTAAFVVVVIGGLGSFWGVVIAALLVGLVKGMMIGLGLSQYSMLAIYLLMFVVLLLRPRGLLGERITRFE